MRRRTDLSFQIVVLIMHKTSMGFSQFNLNWWDYVEYLSGERRVRVVLSSVQFKFGYPHCRVNLKCWLWIITGHRTSGQQTGQIQVDFKRYYRLGLFFIALTPTVSMTLSYLIFWDYSHFTLNLYFIINL